MAVRLAKLMKVGAVCSFLRGAWVSVVSLSGMLARRVIS